MKTINNLPKKIPVFPLSNFIIFPEANVPLNIFESRYIEMVKDSIKGNKMIGIIQPKKIQNKEFPELYNVGCAGKITSFSENSDGRYLIILNGINRFKITHEIKNNKPYRECEVNFNDFSHDVHTAYQDIKISDLNVILKNFKLFFKSKGYSINWKELENQNLSHTINTLAMASPFSLEEKQMLLETENLKDRTKKLEEILSTYLFDQFNNTTIQ
ncbi:MAG: hypothetical protein FD548_000007 [Pelagibacterales bacterium]|nr:hypothetical protein [Pelagibacterales bacterium]